ncbi:hypothetical protein HFP51_02870 [Parasphingopyxis sp. CP4]|uniref:hypothetical protein n=1 Tax=Parasphingopyxis sp. CP4 TaxID=2724527 RepID=UPI0015A13814|nr:hypothetical protein [Parasphingopyxis sp. CP4]QLC21220.1 hypothetical protein HFP51_02870 [Parasphingopyxis sp. CP4]
MVESIRNPKTGAEWLAFYALTWDEPKEFAIDYLRTAHMRLNTIYRAIEDDHIVEAKREIGNLKMVLYAFGESLKEDGESVLKTTISRRRGRPRKTLLQVNNEHRATSEFERLKERDGYESAMCAVTKKYRVSRATVDKIARRWREMREQNPR